MTDASLSESYLREYRDAAKKASDDNEAREEWKHSKWGSPVGVLFLMDEIELWKCRWKAERADHEASQRHADQAIDDAINGR